MPWTGRRSLRRSSRTQLLDKGMTSFDSVGLIMIETNGKFVFLNREQAKRLRPELLAEA